MRRYKKDRDRINILLKNKRLSFEKKISILVVGGTGFIGYHLLRFVRRKDGYAQIFQKT